MGVKKNCTTIIINDLLIYKRKNYTKAKITMHTPIQKINY